MNTPRQLASSFLTPPSSVHRRGNYSICFSLRRSHLCGAALWLFALSSSLFAAPPPELTVLRQQYDKVVAERVTAVFDASKAALDAKFTIALDNAIATAKASGDLPTVLAIQEDKKAIEGKQDLAADTDTTPATLKTLRAIYREQVSNLTEQRTANTAALLAPYAAKLQQLEATLTKNDRVEEAKEVMDYRMGLKADAPAPPVAVTATVNTPATSLPTTAPARAARSFPKADDRKVAVWAQDYAYKIVIRIQGEEGTRSIKPDDALPDAPFVISGIEMNHQTPPKKAFKDLEMIAGLENLRTLFLANMMIQDQDCDVFASLPKLEKLYIGKNRGKLTGERLDLLQACPALHVLEVGECQINSSGIRSIATLPGLQTLTLTNTATADKDVAELARMVSLKSLKLGRTQVTIKGLGALKTLVDLSEFGWSPTPNKAKDELTELASILPGITSFQLTSNKADYSTEDVSGLSAFPKLEKIYLENDMCSKSVLIGVGKLPTVKYVRCYYGEKTTDDFFEGLSHSTSLETIDFDNMPKLTSAVLAHFQKMPNLKKLNLGRCDKIDKAAIAAFKQARPEVTVNP